MAQIGTDIHLAKTYLEAGNVVGIPTETVYGLAANALNPDAVLTIFKVKNRPSFDPLIVHTDSILKVEQFVSAIPDAARILAETCWPGPLTLLLPKRDLIPDLVTSGLSTVAVRIPNHPLTLALLRSLPYPLAAPSANPFGYISPTTAQHVADQLGDQIPYILDGGPALVGLESTIIGFENPIPTIYRLGGMDPAQIERLIGPVDIRTHSTSNPQAPGMLSSHYAPRKPLRLLRPGFSPPPGERTGTLAFRQSFGGITEHHQRVLSPTGDLAEAAKNLFAYLRALDTLDVNVIYAELLPSEGLGQAMNDRLRRASVPDGSAINDSQ
ncbi:L-threonylcarbamoyladenylate synthase [Spirosoma utsteinense]|uniref:Threonylcarbamoyl-AMP synthase n=1 Tax=Spirosoma utsteinense TaxID=2585773 RepID=A0ABR6VZW8_9BACT|nr:L-threonylcarbamoyladenylate synthase [Spirosoma utsteinense]MBC3784556.1 L-threonylcarbamoyladenylate synthase [Spirosoma utsteinense]MBC3789692.1 L-threonylcarbamoyladenylate synthase [Spirosoma utsteinense]